MRSNPRSPSSYRPPSGFPPCPLPLSGPRGGTSRSTTPPPRRRRRQSRSGQTDCAWLVLPGPRNRRFRQGTAYPPHPQGESILRPGPCPAAKIRIALPASSRPQRRPPLAAESASTAWSFLYAERRKLGRGRRFCGPKASRLGSPHRTHVECSSGTEAANSSCQTGGKGIWWGVAPLSLSQSEARRRGN